MHPTLLHVSQPAPRRARLPLALAACFALAVPYHAVLAEVAANAEAEANAEPAPDAADRDRPATLRKIEVNALTKSYGADRSTTATKTDTRLRDVPQAVTVLGEQLIADQGMQSMADVVRFVPPVAALALGPVAIDGDEHARTRPMRTTIDALRGLGVDVGDDGRGTMPFTIHGTGSVDGGS